MPRNIEPEFESYDCEINYRYAQQCLLCDFADNQKIAAKLSESKVPTLLYFCKKHSAYVNPDRVCNEFSET